MYNRYIPQPDGSYRRNRVEDSHSRPQRPAPEPPQRDLQAPSPRQVPVQRETHTPSPRQDAHRTARQPARPTENGLGFLRQLLPKDFDTGDMIVILLLLLLAGDCEEDRANALLTMALYLIL